jgi:hypothetical protein
MYPCMSMIILELLHKDMHMHTCLHIYIYTCMHVLLYIHIHAHMVLHACARVRVVFAFVHMFACRNCRRQCVYVVVNVFNAHVKTSMCIHMWDKFFDVKIFCQDIYMRTCICTHFRHAYMYSYTFTTIHMDTHQQILTHIHAYPYTHTYM